MKIPRILVLGAGGPAGTNFIKSLRMSKTKYYIVGADMNEYHLMLPPIDKGVILPHALHMDYEDKLIEIIKIYDIDFVHAQPDIEVQKLGAIHNHILSKTGAKTFLPNIDAITLCRNKLKCYYRLKNNDVPVPLSFPVDDISRLPEEFEKLMVKQRPEYPPDSVWVRAITGAGSRASMRVHNAEQLLNWVFYWINYKKMDLKEFMMSEYLPGREFAWQSLWFNGKLITSQARERMEYYMGNLSVTGQSSSPSVARTVHNESVNIVGTRAVQAVDKKATGIFCVDMKENARDMYPCVTEINAGRFFTTSNFFSTLGCNMPDIYVQMGLNNKPPTGLKQYDPLPENIYWIRQPDSEPIYMLR